MYARAGVLLSDEVAGAERAAGPAPNVKVDADTWQRRAIDTALVGMAIGSPVANQTIDEQALLDAEQALWKLSDVVASTYFTTRERSEAPWESLG